MIKRYVLFNENLGVYLGSTTKGALWSNYVAGWADGAPTFVDTDPHIAKLASGEGFPPYRLCEVFADMPGVEGLDGKLPRSGQAGAVVLIRASEEACCNACLPTWAKRKKPDQHGVGEALQQAETD